MSYGIIRLQKMTSGVVRGIQIHNQREKEYSHTNPDIDFEKSKNNYDLHNQSSIKYNQKIKERIQQLNLKKAVRKDAIVMVQCLVTSDKEFFDRISKQEQEEFFKDSYEFIKKRYGKENIISANVHLDERTPHMHVNFVPVTYDNRLSAKSLINKPLLIKLHDNFFKEVGKKYNLERGESNKDKKQHLTVQEYKIETKKQEIEKMKIDLVRTDIEIQDKLNSLKIDLEPLEAMRINLDSINIIKPKKTILGAFKDELSLSSNDFESLKKIAQASIILEKKNYELQKLFKEKEMSYKCLSQNYKSNLNYIKTQDEKVNSLSLENQELKEFKVKFNILRKAIGEVCQEMKLPEIIKAVNIRIKQIQDQAQQQAQDEQAQQQAQQNNQSQNEWDMER